MRLGGGAKGRWMSFSFLKAVVFVKLLRLMFGDVLKVELLPDKAGGERYGCRCRCVWCDQLWNRNEKRMRLKAKDRLSQCVRMPYDFYDL